MHAIRLDGAQLNYWVAKAAGLQLQTQAPKPGERHDADGLLWHPQNFRPALDWTHAARFLLDDWYGLEDCIANWFGPDWSLIPAFQVEPLKWFMRAYVATQFGEILEDAAAA